MGVCPRLSSFKRWKRWRCLPNSILRMWEWGGEIHSGGSVKLGDGAGKIDVRWMCYPWTPNCVSRFQIAS